MINLRRRTDKQKASVPQKLLNRIYEIHDIAESLSILSGYIAFGMDDLDTAASAMRQFIKITYDLNKLYTDLILEIPISTNAIASLEQALRSDTNEENNHDFRSKDASDLLKKMDAFGIKVSKLINAVRTQITNDPNADKKVLREEILSLARHIDSLSDEIAITLEEKAGDWDQEEDD